MEYDGMDLRELIRDISNVASSLADDAEEILGEIDALEEDRAEDQDDLDLSSLDLSSMVGWLGDLSSALSTLRAKGFG